MGRLLWLLVAFGGRAAWAGLTSGLTESSRHNLGPGACLCFNRAKGGLHSWKRVMLPRLESPPKLSTKQVTEPGNCPNLSSEISCRPLPFAGNSEDLVQHLGRKAADPLPCIGSSGNKRYGGGVWGDRMGALGDAQAFHLQNGLLLAAFPSQKGSLTPNNEVSTQAVKKASPWIRMSSVGRTLANFLMLPQHADRETWVTVTVSVCMSQGGCNKLPQTGSLTQQMCSSRGRKRKIPVWAGPVLSRTLACCPGFWCLQQPSASLGLWACHSCLRLIITWPPLAVSMFLSSNTDPSQWIQAHPSPSGPHLT